MNIYEETKFLMKKYQISANKNLGQNFLIENSVIQTIVDSANISKEDIVLEIGPGLGTLTKELLQKAKKVIAIELDEKMIQILTDRFCFYDNFELMNQDVLKVDLKKIIEKEQAHENHVKIVANLPYYITTPIIMKLLEEKLPITSITVMVQKEVADRLTAIPGQKDTGAITYCVYYYTEPSKVMIVPSSFFLPAPKVDSEVIHLKIRKKPPVVLKSEEMFFRIIKASFLQRRKTLANGLTNGGICSKNEAKQILEKMNLNENVRGENLTIEQFAQIANFLYEDKKI